MSKRRELLVCCHPVGYDYAFKRVWQDEQISLLQLPEIQIALKPLESWLAELNPV